MKSRVFNVPVLLAVLVLCHGSAIAGEPSRDGSGWGWKESGGSILKEEFAVIDGESYYFDSDGLLVTGKMKRIDDELFYFDENGRCAKNLWKYVEETGCDTGAWYFFTSSGKAFQNGWIDIDGKRYHFSEWKMDHGWYREMNGEGTEYLYYLGTEKDGAAASGWVAWKGADLPGAEEHETGWYYFFPSSRRMVCNREMEIDGTKYAFNEDGRMAAGFVSVNGKVKYYDPATGRLATGWFYVEGAGTDTSHEEGWYYFNSGTALSAGNGTTKLADCFGTARIDDQYYGFDENGKMLTGVVRADNGKYYCFGKDGRMLTGVVDVSGVETTGCSSGELPSDTILFSGRGSAPPVLGASYTGLQGNCVYRNGVRLCAFKDTFEEVEVETEEGTRTYVVNAEGIIRKNGTVTMKNGTKKKVVRNEDSYSLE